MKNIAIIGLMGSGKSTVGALLAKKLRLDFVDIDEEIEKKTKTTISEIFKKKGETFFRELETTTIRELSRKSNQIISTGGGAVQDEKNLEILHQNSTIIYLKTSINAIFERIKNETQRPLLQNSDPLGTLQELLEKRQKNYEKADIIVDTDNKTTDEIVNEIIKNVKS